MGEKPPRLGRWRCLWPSGTGSRSRPSTPPAWSPVRSSTCSCLDRDSRSTARPVGWLLVAAGSGLNAWAVAARHGEAIDRPVRLVTDGPQTWSRNPMYVGWTLLHLGVGLVARSPWVLATWPAAFALVHRQVLREERDLAARFGPDFTDYRERVPRYVRPRRRGT